MSSCFNDNEGKFVSGGRYTIWTAGWSNLQTFAKFYAKLIDSARTTSDVLFNTPTNVVPDGL